MYILIGLLFILVGGGMVISPKTFYTIVESWKSNSQGEPSGFFVFSTRFGGIMVALTGIAAIFVEFLE